MKSLIDEAWRLEPFGPPFAFGAFFSPEDTLLCVCAADEARRLLSESSDGNDIVRIAELTSGSGLVGLYLLGKDTRARLLGLDVDRDAGQVAAWNAELLGLATRATFARSDIWSATTLGLLEKDKPQLIICNPPYVPEAPGTRMQLEAGAGPHGTAHLLRALELTRIVQPEALALSWCSLSDPRGIVAAAEGSGYALDTLFVTAIADGEYSGSVHSYLRDLSDCYINEQAQTLTVVAPDGSARFAFLLFAGAFRRRSGDREAPGAADAVRGICEGFARDGVPALSAASNLPFAVHSSVLNRWDELRLRVMLHGEASRGDTSQT